MLDRVALSGGGEHRLRITVTAAPEKGKANKALIRLIAKKLGLPRSAIQIIAGQHSRDKSLLITGDAADLVDQLSRALVHEGVKTNFGAPPRP